MLVWILSGKRLEEDSVKLAVIFFLNTGKLQCPHDLRNVMMNNSISRTYEGKTIVLTTIMKTRQASKTRKMRQTTLTGIGTPNTSLKRRPSISPNKRFKSDTSDGFDDLPTIKLQSKADEPCSDSNTNRESLARPSRKRRKTFVESDASRSANSEDRNTSTHSQGTRTRRILKGRRAAGESPRRKRIGTRPKSRMESDEDDMDDEVEKDREMFVFSLSVNLTILIKVSWKTDFVRATRKLLSKKAWKS